MGVVISLDMGGSKVHRETETETETEKIEEQSKDLMSFTSTKRARPS
jgi:hypothetical protein